MSTENALLTILVEKINNDTLVLPTLPAIALKVRKAADDPNINLNAMADVIGQAVTRIGLRQIKNIATALAMEQLFVSKNDIVKNYLDNVWQQNLKVVAAAMSVMQLHVKETKNRTLNLDTMTLAALVHNIGVLPILTEAERHPEVFANPTFLNVAIDKLAGRIGASIMREWGFEQEFVNVAENWRDMSVQTDMISYLDFTRLGAVMAGLYDSQKDALLNLAVQKGILEDLTVLQSEDYQELYDSAIAVFA